MWKKDLDKRDEGIAEGHDGHVLDVESILKDYRKGISAHHIVNCWLKVNALPPTRSAEPGNAMGNVHVEDSNALDGL